MKFDLDTLRGFFREAPFMADLGVEAVGFENGRVRTRIAVQPRHLQHTGVVHAGVVASLVDHTMGAAAQTQAPEDHGVLTVEFKTSLMRGARGTHLECEAWVARPGRRLSFAEAEVYAIAADGQRTLTAKASGTLILVSATD
jgi:uncharacterized protein (TIGR00369 family)